MGLNIRINISPLNRVYYLIITVAALVGVLLLLRSASHFSEVEGRDRDKMVHDLEHIRPGFSVAEADSVRLVLRARDSRLSEETYWDALSRDLGIALLVAVILTLAIEGYARGRLREEIRSGVLEAAFRRLISSAVFDQIKGHVIGAKCLKRNWSLEMFLLREHPATTGGDRLYVSRTVLSYDLVSLTGGPVKEHLASGLDRHLTGKDEVGALPRFERVQIGSEIYEGDKMTPYLFDDAKTFKKEHSVSTSGVRIAIRLLELFRVPDTFVWNTPLQCEGAKIVIENAAKAGVAFEVTALTPERDRLTETMPGRTWEYSGGLLPWQGFQIRSFYRGDQLELAVVPTGKEPETERAPQN